MTKKDYILLAAWLKTNYEVLSQMEHKLIIFLMAKELCNKLEQDNYHFNREKFLKACGMPY